MLSQHAHDLFFAGHKVKIVVFEEPAEGIAISVALQGYAAGIFVASNYQRPILNFTTRLAGTWIRSTVFGFWAVRGARSRG